MARIPAAAWIAGLAIVNVILLGWAIVLGRDEVRDGSGSVTTGYNVALAIAATLLAVFAIQAFRLPATLRRMLQTFGLTAQALHALGHHPFLDDHVVYALVLVGLALDKAGHTLGLGERWSRLDVVRRNPWLE